MTSEKLVVPRSKKEVMIAGNRERLNELCRTIQIEQDPQKLTALAEELNQLLTAKEERKPRIERPRVTQTSA